LGWFPFPWFPPEPEVVPAGVLALERLTENSYPGGKHEPSLGVFLLPVRSGSFFRFPAPRPRSGEPPHYFCHGVGQRRCAAFYPPPGFRFRPLKQVSPFIPGPVNFDRWTVHEFDPPLVLPRFLLCASRPLPLGLILFCGALPEFVFLLAIEPGSSSPSRFFLLAFSCRSPPRFCLVIKALSRLSTSHALREVQTDPLS